MNIVAPILIAFVVSVVLSPFAISYLRKLKFSQTEREELESHLKKQGTPTMGGVIITLSMIISWLGIYLYYTKHLLFATFLTKIFSVSMCNIPHRWKILSKPVAFLFDEVPKRTVFFGKKTNPRVLRRGTGESFLFA